MSYGSLSKFSSTEGLGSLTKRNAKTRTNNRIDDKIKAEIVLYVFRILKREKLTKEQVAANIQYIFRVPPGYMVRPIVDEVIDDNINLFDRATVFDMKKRGIVVQTVGKSKGQCYVYWRKDGS